MFRYLIHTNWFKALSFVLALHLLNLSIDLPDQKSQNHQEDLSFNDQESVMELLVETYFGLEDSFKEYDDADQNKQGTHAGFNGFTKAILKKMIADELALYGSELLFNPLQLEALSPTIPGPKPPPRI